MQCLSFCHATSGHLQCQDNMPESCDGLEWPVQGLAHLPLALWSPTETDAVFKGPSGCLQEVSWAGWPMLS